MTGLVPWIEEIEQPRYIVRPSRLLLDKDVVTIGRAEGNDIHIDDQNQNVVGRLHARIECRGDSIILIDNNSTNGTFVEGNRIAPSEHYTLKGSKLLIGLGARSLEKAILRFIDPNLTDRTPALSHDSGQMRFFLEGYPITLSGRQYRVLRYMYDHRYEVSTREQIAVLLWGEHYTADDLANLDEFIRKLRNKLIDALPDNDDYKQTRRRLRMELIVTRRQLGYQLQI